MEWIRATQSIEFNDGISLSILWLFVSVCVCVDICWELKRKEIKRKEKEKRIEDKHNDPWNNFLNKSFKFLIYILNIPKFFITELQRQRCRQSGGIYNKHGNC